MSPEELDDFTVVDIVNAIAVDLTPLANRISPSGYKDWRHRAPDMLSPENAPWLAIWSPDSRHMLLATIDEYQDDDVVVVQWGISIAEFTEQGGEGSDAVITAAMTALRPVESRLKSYSAGLPDPFDNQVLGKVSQTDRSMDKSLCWTQSWILTVTSMGIG